MQVGRDTANFMITELNGRIYARLGKQAPNPLTPLGAGVFGANFDDKLRVTFIVENGKVIKLTLLQNGVTLVGMRKAE